MIRLMQAGDLPLMKELWLEAFGGTPEEAESAIMRFAGETHAWVDEQDGQVAAMALTPPVQIGRHKGVYLCGLATAKAWQGRGLATELMQHIADLLVQVGVEFIALIPETEQLFDFYKARGYQPAFPRRKLEYPLKRNLWSQAEFDTVPVRAIGEMRVKFCPNIVQLSPEAMTDTMTNLYARGITVVSNENGYGMYFRQDSNLRFVELMAYNDKAAKCILEAAREREVIAEQATFTVPDASTLFLGEGTRYMHGMIRFLAQPFEVEDSYLGLALDV